MGSGLEHSKQTFFLVFEPLTSAQRCLHLVQEGRILQLPLQLPKILPKLMRLFGPKLEHLEGKRKLKRSKKLKWRANMPLILQECPNLLKCHPKNINWKKMKKDL